MSARAQNRGFTLVELIAVVAILAVLLMAVVPAMDGMVPKYRLRGAAREIAAWVEQAQSEAIAKRKEYRVAYDLDSNTYWMVLPPDSDPDEEERLFEEEDDEAPGVPGAPARRPEDDVEHGRPPPEEAAPGEEEFDELRSEPDPDAVAFDPTPLPPGVIFDRVQIGDEERQSGTVYVPFTHLSSSGTHTVGLKLDPETESSELSIWVKFNALSRTIEYSDEQPQVRTLSGGGQ